MIIEIEKSVIQEQLAHAAKGVSSKNTIPILSGVKFVVDASGLTMTGSDTKTVVQTFIPVELFTLIENGSVVLEKSDLEKIISKMPNEIIRIQTDNGMITTFTAKKAELKLMGMDAEEYPNFSSGTDDEQIVIKGEVLKSLINQTKFAASDQETTPILTGTVISVNGGYIQFLTCDRHRLARVKEKTESPFEKMMVVDTDCLVNLSKIVNGKDDVTLTTKSDHNGMINQLIFSAKSMLFVARILDGAYPDTSKLIPDAFKEEFTINRIQLISSLELAKITAEDGKTNVARFNFAGNTLVISSKNNKGSMKESLDVESQTGNDFLFSANAEYLLSALKAIEAEYVKFRTTGPMNPIIITPEADEDVLHFCLPYRVTN